ncbi:hypothetical protein Tco_0312684 [Tanacetum coccineum]
MADPPPTGVRAEDICRLCENIIDLLSVHPTMLYEIGLTTIWKHVGHHLVFKDGDENVATSMSQFLKFPMSGGEGDTGNSLDNVGNDTKVKSPHSASSPYFEHSLQSQHSAHSDEDTHAHSNGDGLYHDERGEHARRHASGSTCRVLSSSPGDSARQVYSQRNHGGDKIEHLGCVGKEAALTEKLVVVEKEKDELLDKNWAQEEHIKRLEETLASKTSSLSEAESTASALKGDLERLTIDLSYAEIVRHNYVRQLLPNVFQRLLSSEEYKKTLSDVFNQAIVAGWSKGVKVKHSDEDVEAILATAADYDPECKSTFISAFDTLFVKKYPYVEKLIESFCLPLGDLQNMWSEGKGPTVGSSAANAYHWRLDSFGASCVTGNIFTWSLALGLIRSVLRSGEYSSLGHWRLDSSGASCVLGNILWRLESSGSSYVLKNIRRLAIGNWTHPKRLAFREIFVTWPLALGLIRSGKHYRDKTEARHWLRESVKGS